MTFIEQLTNDFPIRRTKKQKEAFREWFIAWARTQGYAAQATTPRGTDQTTNLLIGDAESAQVVFTAHYDTPAVSFLPNVMTPRNKVFFTAYQMLQVGILIALSVAVGMPMAAVTGDDYAGFLAGYAVYMGLLFLMLFGPANRHNVNDNTSGVAALMETMVRIPADARAKVAFILFDNEEKGCVGSKVYAKAYPVVRDEKPVINLDCVGDGAHVLLMAGKQMRALPWYPALTEAFAAQDGCEFHAFPLETSVFNSDQKRFKVSAAICACQQGKRIGFCCDRIHTSQDTVCEQRNLDFIAQGLANFVTRL